MLKNRLGLKLILLASFGIMMLLLAGCSKKNADYEPEALQVYNSVQDTGGVTADDASSQTDRNSRVFTPMNDVDTEEQAEEEQQKEEETLSEEEIQELESLAEEHPEYFMPEEPTTPEMQIPEEPTTPEEIASEEETSLEEESSTEETTEATEAEITTVEPETPEQTQPQTVAPEPETPEQTQPQTAAPEPETQAPEPETPADRQTNPENTPDPETPAQTTPQEPETPAQTTPQEPQNPYVPPEEPIISPEEPSTTDNQDPGGNTQGGSSVSPGENPTDGENQTNPSSGEDGTGSGGSGNEGTGGTGDGSGTGDGTGGSGEGGDSGNTPGGENPTTEENTDSIAVESVVFPSRVTLKVGEEYTITPVVTPEDTTYKLELYLGRSGEDESARVFEVLDGNYTYHFTGTGDYIYQTIKGLKEGKETIYTVLHIYDGDEVLRTERSTIEVEVLENGVPIDAAHFPDEAFRNLIINKYDSNKDTYLEKSEIEEVTSMSINYNGISDLTGLNYFLNLKTVYIQGEQITEMDFSSNVSLTSINVAYCRSLKTVNVANNSQLRTLNLTHNAITELDISNNNLMNLDCSNNEIYSLKFGNSILMSADVGGNHFAYINDVSCPKFNYSNYVNSVYMEGKANGFDMKTLGDDFDLSKVYCVTTKNITGAGHEDNSISLDDDGIIHCSDDVTSFSYYYAPNGYETGQTTGYLAVKLYFE